MFFDFHLITARADKIVMLTFEKSENLTQRVHSQSAETLHAQLKICLKLRKKYKKENPKFEYIKFLSPSASRVSIVKS